MIGFAHRGAPAPHQRENTLAAFRRALAGGANGLESDVWLSADAIPVLHHDGVFGPPGWQRRIPELPADRLPAWLPTLAAFYRDLGTAFALSLDLKSPAGGWEQTADAVTAVAREAGGGPAVRQLWLCGNLAELTIYRPANPEVRLVNSANLAAIEAGGGIEAYGERLQAAGVDALNLRAREWHPQRAGYAAALHERGLAAFGWDVQRTATLRRLAGYGLDAVYSDHLNRLVRVVRATDAP